MSRSFIKRASHDRKMISLLLWMVVSVGGCSRRAATPVAARATSPRRQRRQAAASQKKSAAAVAGAATKRTDRPPVRLIGERVRRLHEVSSGGLASVVSVRIEREDYRVTLAAKVRGQTRMETALVSRTGGFLLENPIRLRQRLRRLRLDKRFAVCLKKAGLRVLGTRKDKGSNAQYQEIGQFADLVFVDCNGDGQALCKRLAVKSVPSIVVADQIIPGVKNTAWLESFTGCNAAR